MDTKGSMKEILDEYEAHLLENLQKYGPDKSVTTANSWSTLNLGRLIDALGNAIDTYVNQVKLLKRENELLREENEELKKLLRKRT